MESRKMVLMTYLQGSNGDTENRLMDMDGGKERVGPHMIARKYASSPDLRPANPGPRFGPVHQRHQPGEARTMTVRICSSHGRNHR